MGKKRKQRQNKKRRKQRKKEIDDELSDLFDKPQCHVSNAKIPAAGLNALIMFFAKSA